MIQFLRSLALVLLVFLGWGFFFTIFLIASYLHTISVMKNTANQLHTEENIRNLKLDSFWTSGSALFGYLSLPCSLKQLDKEIQELADSAHSTQGLLKFSRKMNIANHAVWLKEAEVIRKEENETTLKMERGEAPREVLIPIRDRESKLMAEMSAAARSLLSRRVEACGLTAAKGFMEHVKTLLNLQ